jgi:hypothetical protein
MLADVCGGVEIWCMTVYFFQLSFCGPNTHENIVLLARIADSHHLNADPDPAFHFNADPDPAPLQSDRKL